MVWVRCPRGRRALGGRFRKVPRRPPVEEQQQCGQMFVLMVTDPHLGPVRSVCRPVPRRPGPRFGRCSREHGHPGRKTPAPRLPHQARDRARGSRGPAGRHGPEHQGGRFHVRRRWPTTQEFSASAWGRENFPKVQEAISKRAVEASTLASAVASNPSAAGKKYGVDAGIGPEFSGQVHRRGRQGRRRDLPREGGRPSERAADPDPDRSRDQRHRPARRHRRRSSSASSRTRSTTRTPARRSTTR